MAPGAQIRLLQDIKVVTHCVERLAPVEAAWSRFLGYATVARGSLSDDLGAIWNASSAVGRSWCLMQPPSGEAVYLRFIETGRPGRHGRPATWGWNATEILVRDPDGLAGRLEGSPFRRLGGPADLYAWERAPRAMQVRGPAGELLYFTRILPNGSRYGMKGACAEVDRVFIVTVSGPSLAALHRFYGDTLGQRVIERAPIINAILADDCHVPRTTRFASSIVRIPGRRFLIELDELPATAGPRACEAELPPPGMAMVSFHVECLDALPVPPRTPARAVAVPPYDGKRAAVITGPAGEWLELIESR